MSASIHTYIILPYQYKRNSAPLVRRAMFHVGSQRTDFTIRSGDYKLSGIHPAAYRAVVRNVTTNFTVKSQHLFGVLRNLVHEPNMAPILTSAQI